MSREPTEMELRVATALGGSNPDDYWIDVARKAIRAMADAPPEFIDQIAGYFMTPRSRLPFVWKAFMDFASPPS